MCPNRSEEIWVTCLCDLGQLLVLCVFFEIKMSSAPLSTLEGTLAISITGETQIISLLRAQVVYLDSWI